MLNDINNIRSWEDLRLLYFKYKDTPHFSIGVIIILVLISFALFGRVVLPQYDRWFSIQNEVKATETRIATLQSNINLLNNLNNSELIKQFNLAKQAMPFEKDYSGIITTIDSVAVKSGVELDDYSFQVGNLSTTSANLAPETAISVKISIKGEIDKIQSFLKELSTITPLSEVVTVSYVNNSAGIGLIFFYKYISSNLTIPYTDPLRVINPTNRQLLQTLSTWSTNASNIPPVTKRVVEDDELPITDEEELLEDETEEIASDSGILTP